MLPGHLSAAVRAALDSADPFVETMSAAHGAATSPRNRLRPPTRAQELAGNYTMGHVALKGMTLMVENPAHTTREGVDPGGKPWRSIMKAHYGYIRGTRGADGDPVDVFIGPAPEAPRAWILNQLDAGGKFDEHKVLLGFHDERSAVDAYRLSYEPGWSRFKPPVPVSIEQLKWWLQWGDLTRELIPEHLPPESDTMEPKPTTNPLPRIFWDSAAMPAAGETVGSVLYALRVDDAAEGLLTDPVTLADVYEGAERLTMDALVVPAGRLEPKMQALRRIMEMASTEVKPLAVQISEPVRRYGGVHVAVIFEMSDGQTITAWFHNPDSTPGKLSISDDLVSWKWQLNKKDITIVVAPEKGTDLNTREVARRVMRLVEKNSAAFARLNAGRAARMAEIEAMKTTVVKKQAELAGLHRRIEVALVEREERQATASKPEWQRQGFNATTPEGYAAVMSAGREAMAFWQDDLDSLFQERLIAVRNALRELGWEGDRMGPLQKVTPGGAGGMIHQLATEFTQVGAGNVVGIVFSVRRAPVVGAVGFTVLTLIVDDLSKTAAELAAALDAAVPKAELPPEVNPIVGSMTAGAMTPGYAEWEDQLITLVEERMEADRGDAQGIVEAKEMMQRGILKRLFDEKVSAETAYQRLFGDEAPLADDEETKPPPQPPELGLDDVTPGAAELLAGNPASLAIAKAIEADVKERGGAVSWSETGQEPAAPVMDHVATALDAVGGPNAERIGKLFELAAKDWRAAYEEVDRYGSKQLAEDIRASIIAFGIDRMKREKPAVGFLGPMFDNVVEAYEKEVLGGVKLSKLNAGQDALRNAATVAKKIIDTAWGKGSFQFLAFKNSRASLSGAYPEAKLPAWAKGLKMDAVDGQPLRERFAGSLLLDSLFELDGARLVRGDITYRSRPLGSVTINGKGEAFFSNPDGSAFNPYRHERDADEYVSEALEEGLMGWTSKASEIIAELMNPVELDLIGQDIDSQVRGAEVNEQDSERAGDPWPATVLDRDNPFWQLTLNEAPELGGTAKSSPLGTLRKGGQELMATLVYRGKNAANWYIVLTKPRQRKMLENIPFPSINGTYKMGRIAATLMGYLDADEASGWRIAPPESDAGKESGGWTLGLVTAEGLRGIAGSRGIAAEVFNEREYQGERAVIGATLELNGVRATLEWKDGSESYSLRTIGDHDGQLDASDTVLSKLLDQFVAWKPAPAAPAESADLAFLKDVLRGAHDALALADLLEKIEASVMGLQEAGQLTGDADRIANEAITRWAELDQKING